MNQLIENIYIVSAAASITKDISTNDQVIGVTSVDDELFVLLKRSGGLFWLVGRHLQDDNHIAVYSINDYKLLRHLKLPGLKLDSNSDMTSCVRHKCLYMSDPGNSCVHRYELASSATSKWPVRGTPVGLSITPSGNLLVTCQQNKLIELSADSGRRVREIILQSDMVDPLHSIQLATGQYVVSHGGDLRRVCVVGDDGKITCSYGGQSGPDVKQQSYPCHVAVDTDSQFIFVAFVADIDKDGFGYNTVVLLSPTVEFVRYVTTNVFCRCPIYMYFHQATRRLFVGFTSIGGCVQVIHL